MSRQSTNVHCMIDLETLGLSLDCAVFEIGAVIFTPYQIIGEFQTFVMPEGEIDPSTVLWHFGQPQRPDILTHDLPPYSEALLSLSAFVRSHQPEHFWSHGVNFDMAILTRAYQRLGIVAPWNYKQLKDTRTLAWLTEESHARPMGTAHMALDDARDQARWVMDMLREG